MTKYAIKQLSNSCASFSTVDWLARTYHPHYVWMNSATLCVQMVKKKAIKLGPDHWSQRGNTLRWTLCMSQMPQISNGWLELFWMSNITVIQCQQMYWASGLHRVKFKWQAEAPAAADNVSVVGLQNINLITPTTIPSVFSLCSIQVWNSKYRSRPVT